MSKQNFAKEDILQVTKIWAFHFEYFMFLWREEVLSQILLIILYG